MKRFSVISATFLASLLVFAIPVRAQQEEHDKAAQQEEKQAKHDEKREQQEKKVEEKAQRSDNHARRIPEEHFRAHFGREHTFVVNRVTVVNGAPRFQNGGYWFVIADPWPAGWVYTDNCYIDFIDGEYYMFDLAHPGVRIAVNVVF